MATSQEDALHLLATRKQPEAKAQKRGMLGTVLVIAGIGVTVFGFIVPALRASEARRAEEAKGEVV